MPPAYLTQPQIGQQPATAGGSGFGDMLEKILPGFGQLGQKATGVVGDMLSGLPSPDTTRTANAYFGARSGMPNSDFVRNRGFDLYGQERDKRQQGGIQNLLGLLNGYGGAANTYRSGDITQRGQDLQNSQFGSQLNQNAYQFNQNQDLEQAKLMLQALGTVKNLNKL